MGYILSNMMANLFGLGNAATPLGIKAMEQLKKLNGGKTASRSMVTFLAINTSSITIDSDYSHSDSYELSFCITN